VNDVSDPAEPGRILDRRQASFVVSRDAKSLTVTFPWNLKDSERGADWISIRLGARAELVLVNSALPNGSPVSFDQFLSRYGSLRSPFRNRLCVVGSSQVSPGPSGPVVDWLATRGDTSINDAMNRAVGITTLDLRGGSNM
jgi:hypothetical protein